MTLEEFRYLINKAGHLPESGSTRYYVLASWENNEYRLGISNGAFEVVVYYLPFSVSIEHTEATAIENLLTIIVLHGLKPTSN